MNANHERPPEDNGDPNEYFAPDVNLTDTDWDSIMHTCCQRARRMKTCRMDDGLDCDQCKFNGNTPAAIQRFKGWLFARLELAMDGRGGEG